MPGAPGAMTGVIGLGPSLLQEPCGQYPLPGLLLAWGPTLLPPWWIPAVKARG